MDWNLVEGTNHPCRDHNLENTGFSNCHGSFSQKKWSFQLWQIQFNSWQTDSKHEITCLSIDMLTQRMACSSVFLPSCAAYLLAWLTVFLSGDLPIYRVSMRILFLTSQWCSLSTQLAPQEREHNAQSWRGNEPENPEKMVEDIKLKSAHVQVQRYYSSGRVPFGQPDSLALNNPPPPPQGGKKRKETNRTHAQRTRIHHKFPVLVT